MDVVFHIVLLFVLAGNCSGEAELIKEWSTPRDKLVARAVNDEKERNYEDMLHHIQMVATEWDQPLNYTERYLLFTAYNKVVLSIWKKIHIRYIC